MPANIDAYARIMPTAVRHFWTAREQAALAQQQRGVSDQGSRGGVTAGKNLDGFVRMVQQIIIDNGIPDAEVFTDGRHGMTLPGFYRPTKNWDLLVVSKGRLLAAVEFKSQVGPSFGNNFNNRVEEALGNATDLLTAYREGAFGDSSRPFLGYFFVLEHCERSLAEVRCNSRHFEILPEFQKTSYAQRYEILCRKLVQETLYDAAALVMTPRQAASSGDHTSLSDITSARRFAATLAGRVSGLAIE